MAKRGIEESNDGQVWGNETNKRFNSGKPTLKFLVSNFMAGKLIGKGGSNVGVLQSRFNASMHISPNKEFYPGTADRIVSLQADIDQIMAFNNYIISEIEEDGKSDGSNPSLKQEIKMVLSDVAAGLVIGKGGACIKAIQTASNGAKMHISKKEESIPGERVLVVSGDCAQLATATKQVIDVISTAPDKMSPRYMKYNTYNNPPMQMPQNNPPVYNYQSDNHHYAPGNAPNGVNNMSSVPNGNNYGNNYGNSNYQPKSAAKIRFQAEMEIPDKMVGSILGRQGQTITEFSRTSGAKLQFSGKDEFAPGTTDRILTITGGMYQVQNAYILVDDKLSQIEREFNFMTQ